jgi:hypothetical protein
VALLDGPKKEPNGDVETPDPAEVDSDSTIITLRSINAVTAHVPFIEDAQAKITAEMESMILTGLDTLVSIPFPYILSCSWVYRTALRGSFGFAISL